MKSLCPVYLGSNTYKRKLNKSKVVSTFKKYFVTFGEDQMTWVWSRGIIMS